MIKRDFIYSGLLSTSIVILDQLTKYLATLFLVPSHSLPVVPGVFHLTLIHNQGAAFGLFKGGIIFFILASFACIMAIILLGTNHRGFSRFFALDSEDKIIRFSLGLILGGACGNLIDRLRFAYVVDFLDFRIWPVFNLADSAITIGSVLLAWKILKTHKKAINN